MTDYINAEKLRHYYLTHSKRKEVHNVCHAIPNWNGCDYCDVYSGAECWKQDGKHKCVRLTEERIMR